MFPIFSYDKRSDEVKINNEIILELDCFKKVWTRKNPSKGDSDGSKKLSNKKEFMYIFFMADMTDKNPYRSYNEEARHEAAIKDCGFSSHWVPDNLVRSCMAKYQELILSGTPTLKFLVEAEQAIRQAAEHLEILRKQNDEYLEWMKKEKFVDQEKLVNMQNNLGLFFSLIGRVADINTQRSKLEKVFLEESQSAETARGGRKIGNRE